MSVLDGLNMIDAVTESPEARAERLEEARIENEMYEDECREDRDFEEQEKFDSGMCESDFL